MNANRCFYGGLLAALMLVGREVQSQTRYSWNAVGYVDVRLVAGSNLIANPLYAGDNSIANVLRGLPSGSYYLPFVPNVGFTPTNSFHESTGWTDPTMPLRLTRGGFLWLPEARTVSFTGEPWPAATEPWPSGFTVSGVLPSGPFIPMDFSVLRWDPVRQRWADDTIVIYDPEWGWIPEPPVLHAAEAAMIFNPGTAFLFQYGLGAPARPVTLINPRRAGDEFAFEFLPPSGGTYTYHVQRSSDLTAGVWQTIRMVTVASGSSLVAVTVPMEGSPGFYRLSDFILREPVRTGTRFEFRFPSELGVRYTVSRAASLPSSSWQVVKVVDGTGAMLVVADDGAVGTVGYYRVEY